MKILFALIFFPVIALGQNKLSYNQLIEKINHSLNQYSLLSPSGISYYPISSFGFPKNEITELIMEADRPDLFVLSKKKDSIENFYMIDYFKEKIIGQINQLIKHPDFLKNDIRKLITSSELNIEISEDNKLFNFSFDAKNGGMSYEQINITHYTNFTTKDSSQLSEFNSFFSSDGHIKIYTLNTKEGKKYVLTEYIRGCSYCFETTVRLISFNNNKFKEEFLYSLNSTDYNSEVSYNHETKTIFVDYYIDDLTPYCYCSGEVDKDKYSAGKVVDNNTSINCQCKFIFNGLNFELVEESSKKVSNINRKQY